MRLRRFVNARQYNPECRATILTVLIFILFYIGRTRPLIGSVERCPIRLPTG